MLWAQRSRWVVVGTVILGLGLPGIWFAVNAGDFAVGDIALIELRVRDVLSAHPPLVGAYSRYGWSHPGPLQFYLFAVPYRLFGGDLTALRLTAVLFNAGVIAAIMWTSRQRGRAASLALLGAAVLMMWGLPTNSMSDSWNVTIALLPFMLTVVACWCALCGDRYAWLVAAVAFSFTFQAHIGFGLVLTPLVAVTAARLVVTSTRDSVPSRRCAAVGVGAAATLALPLILDVFANWPGNLARLARWSINNDEPTIGVGAAFDLIGRATSLSFPLHARLPNQFLLSLESIDRGTAPGMALLALVGALLAARRFQMKAEYLLCASLSIVWASGLFAATRVTQPLAYWLVDWLQPLAWLTWAAVTLVAWRLTAALRGRVMDAGRTSTILVTALAAGFVIGTVAYVDGIGSVRDVDPTTAPIEALVDATHAVAAGQRIHIDYEGDPFTSGTIFLAVANQLDRDGFDLCVAPQYANQFGDERVCVDVPEVQLIIRAETTVAAPPPHMTLIAISDPLTEEERLEADSLAASLASLLAPTDLDALALLETPLVSLVIDHIPEADRAAAAPFADRLSELRQVPGTRIALYRVIAASRPPHTR